MKNIINILFNLFLPGCWYILLWGMASTLEGLLPVEATKVFAFPVYLICFYSILSFYFSVSFFKIMLNTYLSKCSWIAFVLTPISIISATFLTYPEEDPILLPVLVLVAVLSYICRNKKVPTANIGLILLITVILLLGSALLKVATAVA